MTHRSRFQAFAILIASLLIAPLSAPFCLAQDAQDAETAPFKVEGQVNANAVYIRSGASENDYPTIKLDRGQPIDVLAKRLEAARHHALVDTLVANRADRGEGLAGVLGAEHPHRRVVRDPVAGVQAFQRRTGGVCHMFLVFSTWSARSVGQNSTRIKRIAAAKYVCSYYV